MCPQYGTQGETQESLELTYIDCICHQSWCVSRVIWIYFKVQDISMRCPLCEGDFLAVSTHYLLDCEGLKQVCINHCPRLRSMEDVKKFLKHPKRREAINKLSQQQYDLIHAANVHCICICSQYHCHLSICNHIYLYHYCTSVY